MLASFIKPILRKVKISAQIIVFVVLVVNFVAVVDSLAQSGSGGNNNIESTGRHIIPPPVDHDKNYEPEDNQTIIYPTMPYPSDYSNKSQDDIKQIVNSVWFPFITGIASIIGVILTLYTLRVRRYTHLRYRLLEWQKIIIIAIGVGLLTFGSIYFYIQSRPPAFFLFKYLYDSIHGFCGSQWDSGPYYFNATNQTKDDTVTVTEVSFVGDETHVVYHALFTGVNQRTLFPDAGIRIGSGKLYFPINHEKNKNGSRTNGSLVFPSVADECGTLSLWENVSVAKKSDKQMDKVTFRLTVDPREEGTSVWGILSVLGISLIIIGIRYDPFTLMKSKLLNEGKNIRKQQAEELFQILRGRSYEELSADEKHKYDETREYYARNLEIVFDTLSGMKHSNKNDRYDVDNRNNT